MLLGVSSVSPSSQSKAHWAALWRCHQSRPRPDPRPGTFTVGQFAQNVNLEVNRLMVVISECCDLPNVRLHCTEGCDFVCYFLGVLMLFSGYADCKIAGVPIP